METASTGLLRLKHDLRTLLDLYPGPFKIQLGLRGLGRLGVTRDTDIVIEGYPRTGNTFAVAAFKLAQPRPLEIARHTHAPAQVILAVRWGIPTMVLVRVPVDAAVSLMIRAPYLTHSRVLRDYVRYYETLLPYRDRFEVARFEEVTSDFGEPTRRLNARFGTDFAVLEPTADNEQRAMKMVEQMELEDSGLPEVREMQVARPSAEREPLQRRLRVELESPELAPLRDRADRVYQEFVRGG